MLKDLPDLKFCSTDTDSNGNPTPRGEILFRGPAIIPGYYKNEQLTYDVIDKDGWLHSGDIGEIDVTNGSLKVIDRKHNIFTLKTGEIIAPQKIESVYLSTNGISEIFVYGDPTQPYLVGVVVPQRFLIEKL
jgi:long-chain acyl-CoA synthetase